jgi:succinylglutamic semialdehyde dehydrogenase
MVALELGGNNPIIAWDVEDPGPSASIIVRSAFLSSGQRCTCARRLIVAEGPAGDSIVDAVVELAGRLRVGSPRRHPDPFFGPVISEQAARRVVEAQDALVDQGARILLPARPGADGPAYVTPGIVDVSAVGERPDVEIFGPLLQVIRVATFADAILEANNTSFGLAAAVLTDSDDRWNEAAPLLDAGIVNRNVATVGASGAAPFGGIKASGNHRPAGYHAADYCAYPVAGLEEPAHIEVSPILEVD